MISKETYDALGFAGGIIIAVGLLPQIVKTVLTRSAIDISYSWQGIYAVGICVSLVYAYGLKLYPLAVPLTLELAFVLTLAALKFVFDRRSFKNIETLSEQGQSDDGGAQELTSRPQSPPADSLENKAPGRTDHKSSLGIRPASSASRTGIEQIGPEGSPFLVVENNRTARATGKKGNNVPRDVDENKTWHGGPRSHLVSPLQRTISMQEGSKLSINGTWHGTRGAQRLASIPARIVDEESGRVSPRAVVRVIDPQSPLQRWL